jgi:hypothetical protein
MTPPFQQGRQQMTMFSGMVIGVQDYAHAAIWLNL